MLAGERRHNGDVSLEGLSGWLEAVAISVVHIVTIMMQGISAKID
jgi:hypothetical protein